MVEVHQIIRILVRRIPAINLAHIANPTSMISHVPVSKILERLHRVTPNTLSEWEADHQQTVQVPHKFLIRMDLTQIYRSFLVW